MDEFDRRILRVVQKNPATSMADLAAAVGLSQTPCWRRLKKLEADGLILRHAVLLDAKKLGFEIDVFAALKIGRHDQKTLEDLEERVRAIPEIVECFSMSGESDYLLRIVARSIEDYERFFKTVILALPGVTSVNSSFALQRVKVTTDIPV